MADTVAAVGAFLERNGLDGYLVDADGTDADQRYLSGFDAPDPFQTLVTPSESAVLVSGLEYGRARENATVDTVVRRSAYDYQTLVEDHGQHEGRIRTIAAFCADFGVESVAVPHRFPTGTADGLRANDVAVTVDSDGIVTDVRACKSMQEVVWIRGTQGANESAMATAEALIAEATVVDGTLSHEGEPLTSERVREEIEIALLREGCGLDQAIVACGPDSADPHDRGSGPLQAGEPIVVDIFPKDKESGYYGDMTRTFCRGEPPAELTRRYEVVKDAQEAALAAVEPGASGADVHAAACDVIEDAGYETLRTDPDTETGFIHSTGHGVGLDLHERPQISPSGGDLEVGHVLTIEPGLYDPAVGGVRIEDLVLVTEDGCENLTGYPIADTPTAHVRSRRVGDQLDAPGV